ncbi:LysR family transcriptional regulator [Salinicola corii]|uniref:LysR family transcriptional regulator n=1 Tax=Salinicola corii TaxID=2606937 RepID=A0A640W988_9GAMM|nr:LysR family transcriptional regulator [Salinicola corii]KAA0016467.1 LysR family transcriptional regulator [Salinicola corii]
MTIKQLRAFLAVAQTLSFVQACERLHVTQSALSLAVKSLESQLGGALFSRTTRQVRLTPEGEALLPLARRLLAEWDDAEDAMRRRFHLQQGHLAIAAMPSFASNCLPPLIAAFRRRYPRISVTIHDVINEQVVEMVLAQRVEFGIAFEPPRQPALTFTPIHRDRFVAAVPPMSALAAQASTTWSALLAYPFITLQRPSQVRVMLERQLSRHGMTLPVELESHQLATVGQLVGKGLGVSAVPALCRVQMEALGVRCLALSDPVIERPVGVVTRADQQLSSTASAFHALVEGSGREIVEV